MGDEKHGLFGGGDEETSVKVARSLFVEGTADLVKQKDVATVEQSTGLGVLEIGYQPRLGTQRTAHIDLRSDVRRRNGINQTTG